LAFTYFVGTFQICAHNGRCLSVVKLQQFLSNNRTTQEQTKSKDLFVC